MRTETFVATVSCLLLAVTLVAGDLTVGVTMMYPETILAPNSSVGLRGSYPLSWLNSLTLSYTAKNTWTSSFVLSSDILNASFPTFAVDMKVIINNDTWQIGCNDRFTFTVNQTNPTGVSVYPYFYQYKGTTATIKNVHSAQLNNSRDVWLYIPPGMAENTLRLERNVLIMHDGQNLEPLWQVNSILDSLIGGGVMESVFVVGPYNTPDRIAEYTYSVDPQYGGGKGDLYLDFLQYSLLPLIQDEYNVLTEQQNVGIMGSSLGGLISCYAAVTRPSIYSKAGCMSSSFWWNTGDFLSTIVPRVSPSIASATQFVYVDSGDSGDTDDDVTDTSKVSTALVSSGGFELGRNFFWFLQRGGQHNEASWSSRFHFPMEWLYFRSALNNANGLQ